MNSFHFLCQYEESYWQIRAIVYTNEYLYLYEVEPEDRRMRERFGIKFITQPKDSLYDIRCSNPTREHAPYENAVVSALTIRIFSSR